MSKKPSLTFEASSADYILRKYLKMTIIRFTPEMGARLSEIRRDRMKLTQKKLADLLTLSQTDICRLEAGKKVNALPTADIFKTVLNKYFDYVMFGGWLMDEFDIEARFDKRIRKNVGRVRS